MAAFWINDRNYNRKCDLSISLLNELTFDGCKVVERRRTRPAAASPWSVHETVLTLDCRRCCLTKPPGCSVFVVLVDVFGALIGTPAGTMFDCKLSFLDWCTGENTGYDSSEPGCISDTGGELNDKRVGSKYASSEWDTVMIAELGDGT